MGLFSFVGSLFGAGAQKKASQNATNEIVAALNRGIDTQNAFQQQTRSDYLPYTEAGTQAIGNLGDLVGLGGNDAQAASIDALKASPLFKTLFDTGQEAVLQNAAATGGIRGGNTQRGLADFGADTLAQVIESQIAKLTGVGQLGLGAQGNVTQAGQGVTNNVTKLLGDIGGAKATNLLTKGGLTAGMWKNGGDFLDSAVTAFLPGGGGLGKLF